MLREEILSRLEKRRGETVSGGELARELGVSRTAVWKAVSGLREQGFQIDAVPSGGYLLRADCDVLSVPAVAAHLTTRALGRELSILPIVSSTNNYLKERALEGAPHGAAVLAEEQSGGRGRMGRSFCSPKGAGMYLSVLLRPQIPLAEITQLTVAAAVAVSQAVEELGGSPSIKWVNDVYLGKKKLCGILTEAAIEGESGGVQFLVCGIGVNVHSLRNCPDEVTAVATSLEDSGLHTLRAPLAASVLNHLEQLYGLLLEGRPDKLLELYKSRLNMLGKTVTVIERDRRWEGRALDLDDHAGLIVEQPDGTRRTLSSGEISIRF